MIRHRRLQPRLATEHGRGRLSQPWNDQVPTSNCEANILIEEGGDRILGFTAFGAEAGEVMAVVQVAMAAGLPYTALRDTIFTHPTIAEGLGVLFSAHPTKLP